MSKSNLVTAIVALEAVGFTVDRAVEEDARDAGFVGGEGDFIQTLNEKTGAILIRCTPAKDSF